MGERSDEDTVRTRIARLEVEQKSLRERNISIKELIRTQGEDIRMRIEEHAEDDRRDREKTERVLEKLDTKLDGHSKDVRGSIEALTTMLSKTRETGAGMQALGGLARTIGTALLVAGLLYALGWSAGPH